ncbi:hypothetical protein PV11_02864 [Exophiala sideris]|uniref:Uncharacterized protein n=1 Tax=Exophiala sideris TaxID=1016849 RepID=A0A0D1Z0G0_9EURO|nr:hypothetical protein PV11_02864 [Exophiala sideris]
MVCLKELVRCLGAGEPESTVADWQADLFQCVELLLSAPEIDINVRNNEDENAVSLVTNIHLPTLHQLFESYGLDLSEPLEPQTLQPHADFDVLSAADKWAEQCPQPLRELRSRSNIMKLDA